MKFGAKKNPTVLAGGHVSRQISFKMTKSLYSVEKKIVGISQYAYFSVGLPATRVRTVRIFSLVLFYFISISYVFPLKSWMLIYKLCLVFNIFFTV
jgi:hypothetical protein